MYGPKGLCEEAALQEFGKHLSTSKYFGVATSYPAIVRERAPQVRPSYLQYYPSRIHARGSIRYDRECFGGRLYVRSFPQ